MIFEIPCRWVEFESLHEAYFKVCGIIQIEANSIDEAIEKIDDSFTIDREGIKEEPFFIKEKNESD